MGSTLELRCVRCVRCVAKETAPKSSFSIVHHVMMHERHWYVFCYVSNKCEVFSAFRFWINRRHKTQDKQTDGVQHFILYHPDIMYFGAIGSAATMRARCWCFALCKDDVCYSGNIWMLIVQWKIPCLRKTIAVSLLNLHLQSGANVDHVLFAAAG